LIRTPMHIVHGARATFHPLGPIEASATDLVLAADRRECILCGWMMGAETTVPTAVWVAPQGVQPDCCPKRLPDDPCWAAGRCPEHPRRSRAPSMRSPTSTGARVDLRGRSANRERCR
jgi:hypothetical protein